MSSELNVLFNFSSALLASYSKSSSSFCSVRVRVITLFDSASRQDRSYNSKEAQRENCVELDEYTMKRWRECSKREQSDMASRGC